MIGTVLPPARRHRGNQPEGIAQVEAVRERFRLDVSMTTAEVVDAFFSGSNPMRSHPLIVSSDGRMMLPHPVLNPVAVRENLEDFLKGTAVWEVYAKHRGDYLESRTRTALERVLPGATFRDAFQYYVPQNPEQESAGDPAKYSKRVESDHLIVLGDVAIIVEDKAVALSALARGGKTTRLRSDLTGIITKAAEQAGRLRTRIEQDGGIHVEGEGWVDLSHIREIHTVAVSLDDTSILAATAALIEAELLAADNIPWTVSIHDLDLITQLVDRPAEFLLYLRRRRNAETTVMFSAPDELDLFLFFQSGELWVEPDPTLVREAFPFLPPPTTSELRRYRTQQPATILSRTDPLDAWYYSTKRRIPGISEAPKPSMVAAPLHPLIDELQKRGAPNWFSIGATLLSLSSTTQAQFARNPVDLLNAPSATGRGRSLTVPLTGTPDVAEAWIMAWATLPARVPRDKEVERLRSYIRVKKHQIGVPRAVLFLYDEVSRQLVDVIYDAHLGPLDEATSGLLRYLQPAAALSRRLPPNAKGQRKLR